MLHTTALKGVKRNAFNSVAMFNLMYWLRTADVSWTNPSRPTRRSTKCFAWLRFPWTI